MEHRPLLVTSDPDLLDDVLRMAAATGVELQHEAEPINRGAWRTAPLIVIDLPQVASALGSGFPRRDGLIAITRTAPDEAAWQQCMRLGVEQVVRHPAAGGGGPDGGVDAEQFLVERFSRLTSSVGEDGAIVAVLGACGGAGATVLAAATAIAAQRGGRHTLLADCDPWGAGLDVVLGIEPDVGLHWSDLDAPAGRLSTGALRRALPSLTVGRDQLPVLTYGTGSQRQVAPDVVDVVLTSVRRAGELAVVDLPRTPEPVADRVLGLAALAVLVVPADVRSTYAALRQRQRLADLGVPAALVVRGPAPGGLTAPEISQALGLEVLATMRPQARLATELDNGRPPGLERRSQLARAAERVVAGVQQLVAA